MSESSQVGSTATVEMEMEVEVEVEAEVAESKKEDAVNIQETKSVVLVEEEGVKKENGIKIVEFENGGGEIYVGEEENWVEKLKDPEVWKWHGRNGVIKTLQVLDHAHAEGRDDDDDDDEEEEIVWEDDVFNLKDIKKVPQARGEGDSDRD